MNKLPGLCLVVLLSSCSKESSLSESASLYDFRLGSFGESKDIIVARELKNGNGSQRYYRAEDSTQLYYKNADQTLDIYSFDPHRLMNEGSKTTLGYPGMIDSIKMSVFYRQMDKLYGKEHFFIEPDGLAQKDYPRWFTTKMQITVDPYPSGAGFDIEFAYTPIADTSNHGWKITK